MVGGSLRVLRLPPPQKWSPWYSWNIAESGIKHNKSIKSNQIDDSFYTMIVISPCKYTFFFRNLVQYSSHYNCESEVHAGHCFSYIFVKIFYLWNEDASIMRKIKYLRTLTTLYSWMHVYFDVIWFYVLISVWEKNVFYYHMEKNWKLSALQI